MVPIVLPMVSLAPPMVPLALPMVPLASLAADTVQGSMVANAIGTASANQNQVSDVCKA